MQQILNLLVQHQLITHLTDTPTFGDMK
jgi:hypothetical protein